MSMKPIQLSIVDEFFLFRKTLINYLLEQDDFRVIHQTSSMFELSLKLENLPCDVLLIHIPDCNQEVRDTLQEVRLRYPRIKLLVLSMSTDMKMISDLLDIGIHAYISVMEEPEELTRAIRTVANSKLFCNQLFTEALYWSKQNDSRFSKDELKISLSGREKKVLQLLWEEKNNKEIAGEIFLSVRSIEKIRQDMKEKLGIRSTIGLLKYAIERKIIPLNRMVNAGDPLGIT